MNGTAAESTSLEKIRPDSRSNYRIFVAKTALRVKLFLLLSHPLFSHSVDFRGRINSRVTGFIASDLEI